MCDIIILIGRDFSRNALKRQAFGSAAFLFENLWAVPLLILQKIPCFAEALRATRGTL
jgi:hypothetical protein